jgi:hypothetical protein
LKVPNYLYLALSNSHEVVSRQSVVAEMFFPAVWCDQNQ